MRYFRIDRIFLIFLFVLVCQMYYNYRTFSSQSDRKILPIVVNQTKSSSIFHSRFNERLFRLAQRFSHLNLDLLLSIQSSSTQTLTYHCTNYCGGWGDRLRGITSTYILSVLLRRRFLLDMQTPCALSNFLLPNLINWLPQHPPLDPLKLNSMNSKHQAELYSNMSSVNLTKLWSSFDHILLTTNSDYITPLLKNPYFQSIISELHIRTNESSQQELFPFIFELLFKPTALISEQLDALLHHASKSPLICLHIRIGQNPSMPTDVKLPHRQTLVPHMTNFLDRNLSHVHSSIFVTSDSIGSLDYLRKHYGSKRILTIDGPIIHIDRYDRKNDLLFRGFSKVIADFYFLGECDILLMPRSGFSHWANLRRKNAYANLYIYCQGFHRVTNSHWRRPHLVC